MAREVGGEGAALLLGVDLDGVPGAPLERLAQQVGEAGERARAEDDVGAGDVLAYALAVALGDAAAYGHDAPPRGRPGRADHGGGLAVEALVGVLPHAAGHEDDDVGLLGLGDRDAAALVEQAGDPLGVVKVHLASEGADAVGLAHEGPVARRHDASSGDSGSDARDEVVGALMRCT